MNRVAYVTCEPRMPQWEDDQLSAEVLAERGVVTAGDVATTTDAWHAAAARTPHGQPIEL